MDEKRTTTGSPEPPCRWRWGWLAVLLLVFAVAAAFLPVLDNPFVNWDDDENFLANRHYRGLGWDQIAWAWQTWWLGVYQPLAWMLLEVEYAFFGLDARGYHLVSVATHALNAVVLYALTVVLLTRCGPVSWPISRGIFHVNSALGAALFAVHPLRVEAVAWASCQPYLPCCLFSMLAVLAYLRAHPSGSPRRPAWLFASGIFFAAGLLCKAVAMTLPAVLVILDIYPLRRLGPGRWLTGRGKAIWLEKLPFVALSVSFMVVAYLAKRAAFHVVSAEAMGIGGRIAQSAYGLCFYAIKTIWPFGLSSYYPRPKHLTPAEPRFAACVLAVAVGLTAAFLLRRRWPGLLAVLTIYLVMLAPNVGLVPLGNQIAADRYSYLAMLGWSPLFAYLLCQIAAGYPARGRIAIAGSLVLVLCLVVQTRRQCLTWSSSEVLFAHALANCDRPDAKLEANMGLALAYAGRDQEAIKFYERSLQLDPASSIARTNYAMALLRRGSVKRAIAELSEAVRLDPESAEGHIQLARALERAGLFRESRSEFSVALKHDPESVDARVGMAWVLGELGDLERAEFHATQAVRLDPSLGMPHSILGTILVRRGKLDQAIAHFKEALRLWPDSLSTRINLGRALCAKERYREAIAQYADALRIDPRSADAHAGMGNALARSGRLDEAVARYSEALRLRPEHPGAIRGLEEANARRTQMDPGR